ncbi:hypothetical protein KAI52_01400 [Candidatus Parcubacteria bacterium]|nr:hypothetical protein [Candidatus Parcubacteria bacterium]
MIFIWHLYGDKGSFKNITSSSSFSDNEDIEEEQIKKYINYHEKRFYGAQIEWHREEKKNNNEIVKKVVLHQIK